MSESVYNRLGPSHVPLSPPPPLSLSPPMCPVGLCSATLVSAAGRGGALTYRASGTATVPTKSQHAPHTFTNPPTHRVRAGRLLCRWGGGWGASIPSPSASLSQAPHYIPLLPFVLLRLEETTASYSHGGSNEARCNLPGWAYNLVINSLLLAQVSDTTIPVKRYEEEGSYSDRAVNRAPTPL